MQYQDRYTSEQARRHEVRSGISHPGQATMEEFNPQKDVKDLLI